MNNVTSGLLRAELSDARLPPSAITHLLVDLSRAEWQSGGQADKDRRDPHFHKRFCVAPSVNPKGRRQRGRENEEGPLLFVRQRGEEMSWGREIEGQRIMNDNELLGGIPVTLKEMWFGSAKRNSDGNFSEGDLLLCKN